MNATKILVLIFSIYLRYEFFRKGVPRSAKSGLFFADNSLLSFAGNERFVQLHVNAGFSYLGGGRRIDIGHLLSRYSPPTSLTPTVTPSNNFENSWSQANVSLCYLQAEFCLVRDFPRDSGPFPGESLKQSALGKKAQSGDWAFQPLAGDATHLRVRVTVCGRTAMLSRIGTVPLTIIVPEFGKGARPGFV
jgi:hypothetical protein